MELSFLLFLLSPNWGNKKSFRCVLMGLLLFLGYMQDVLWPDHTEKICDEIIHCYWTLEREFSISRSASFCNLLKFSCRKRPSYQIFTDTSFQHFKSMFYLYRKRAAFLHIISSLKGRGSGLQILTVVELNWKLKWNAAPSVIDRVGRRRQDKSPIYSVLLDCLLSWRGF